MQGMGAGKTTRTVVVVKLGKNSNKMRAGAGFSPLAVGLCGGSVSSCNDLVSIVQSNNFSI
jgi:hypothetical protein